MHKSRLGTLIIDCKTDDLKREAEFWGAALGGKLGRTDPNGLYQDIETDPADPKIILQKVEHPSWIHLDIETDDREAEVARLQELGASIVEVMERWTVMEAPSGHRFCVIGPVREGFSEDANVWD